MIKENFNYKNSKNILSFMQDHLGYTDEEMKLFLKNPRIKTTLKQTL
ncbi:MAG: hypothetical protein ACFFD2_13570 [Promethearchaeota archaeon]